MSKTNNDPVQRYNTGNEVGSNDVKDLSDNAKNFDIFSTSKNKTFKDRLGNTHYTLKGLEYLAKKAGNAS